MWRAEGRVAARRERRPLNCGSPDGWKDIFWSLRFLSLREFVEVFGCCGGDRGVMIVEVSATCVQNGGC